MDAGERMETMARTTASAMRHKLTGDDSSDIGAGFSVDPDEVQPLIDAWPQAPRTIAAQLLERYGPPNEATPTKLMWYRNGPWRRTVVTADEVVHDFPTPHTDFLSQYVAYRVPVEVFSELARFDGSLLLDRTAGEMGARCDMEPMNTLTLNLAHDIITGRRTVGDARKFCAETVAAYQLGRATAYTEKLLFDAADDDTGDPDDRMVAGPLAHQLVEKAKDVTGRGKHTSP